MEATNRLRWVDPRKAAVLSLVLLGGLVLGFWLVSWAGDALGKGDINITRAELEAARSKWRTHGITEYEMVLGIDPLGFAGSECISCAIYTLDMRDNDVTILSFITSTVGSFYEQYGYGLFPDRDQLSNNDTVERLFDRLDEALSNGSFRCDNPPVPVLYRYTINFDAQLGYPMLLKIAPIEGGTRECQTGTIEVIKSLRVLKQSTGK